MIVTKITLHNWQGYYGTWDFNFAGTYDKSSSFIYADNTAGKTAFWEAFQFALYGRVERRRNKGKFKPPLAQDSGDHPLLNTDVFGEVGAGLYVELHFSHDECEYRLYRGYKPKYEGFAPTKSSHIEQDLMLENLSKRGNERHIADQDRWIKENILPERLSKFFLFDGERLEEYEDLMTKDEDIDLRDDIENIIRTPVLSTGNTAFRRLENSFRQEVGKALVENEKNAKRKKMYQKISKDLDEARKSQKSLLNERKRLDGQSKEIEEWLLDNDKTKEASIRLEAIKTEIEDTEKAILGFRADITNEMQGAWRVIISPIVNESLEKLGKEKKDQKKLIEGIGRLKEDRKHLNHELEGKPCESCKRARDLPDSERKREIEANLSKLSAELDRHEVESKYPTDEEFHNRNTALNALKTSKIDLSILLGKETQLIESQKKLKKAHRNREKQLGYITEEKSKEVRSKVSKQKDINQKKEKNSEEMGQIKLLIEKYQEDLKDFNDSKRDESKESGKTKKLRKSVALSAAMNDVFGKSLEEFREKMRAKVEKRATKTFLQISNNRDNYESLQITDDYAVSIINKKGKRDAGSQAQSLVMAYSIIEALSSCSGFEFPMIIDTPGRGLATSNISSVYEFFTDSKRQVIFLPNTRELDPEEGDQKYGKKVAATYQLVKTDKDRTEVKPRVDNLR